MAIQYGLTGGQLRMDKLVFTKELMSPGSSLKKLLPKQDKNSRQPGITKTEDLVIIDYNVSSGILMDEGFYDVFKKLKLKYKEKVKGRVVIQISAVTSYYVSLNLDSEDDKVIYE